MSITIDFSFIMERSTDDENGCWIWDGWKNDKGYGYYTIYTEKKSVGAHVLSYQVFKGEIPEGYEVDHVKRLGCKSKACVNPFHLEAVTSSENKLRASRKGHKTHCSKGHEFTPENSGTNSRGYRYCLECKRLSSRKHYNTYGR